MPTFLSPPLVLSLVIASAYAAIFNLWQGGGAKKLPLHLVASWLGFGISELAGDFLGLDAVMIGQIHVLEGSLGSWLVMILARWLKM